jgi:hypothetical protein
VSPLEQTYRRTLRWYPRKWRATNEDAVLGTLLDVADEAHRTAPAKGELANLRASGIAGRMGVFGRVLSPAIRNRVSAIALGTGVAISGWGIVFGMTNGQTVGNFYNFYGVGPSRTFGPFTSLSIILYLLWALAFVASLIGPAIVMRVLLVATFPAAIVARVVSEHLGMNLFPSTTTVLMLELFALLAVFGSPRPRAQWRIWVGVSAAIAIASLTWILWRGHYLPTVNGYFFYEREFLFRCPPFVTWICAGAAVIVTACLAIQRWMWATVVTISALPWLALYVSGNPGDLIFWSVTAVLLALAAAAISLRMAGYRIHITKV